MLPLGLDPVTHFHCGTVTDSPLAAEPPVPDDMDFALRTCLEQGRGIRAWRRKQFNILKSICKRAADLQEHLDAGRSTTSRRVAHRVRLDRIDLCRFALQWPDSNLLHMSQRGAGIAGEVAATGIYRPAEVIASVAMEDFESTHDAYVQEIDLLHVSIMSGFKVLHGNTSNDLSWSVDTCGCHFTSNASATLGHMEKV